jgi:hypothetical protein
MRKFRRGRYSTHVAAEFRPRIDAALNPVAMRAETSILQIKQEIANGLASYLNLGALPAGSSSLHQDDRFGQVYVCTLSGVQVQFCVNDRAYEIIVVGVGI